MCQGVFDRCKRRRDGRIHIHGHCAGSGTAAAAAAPAREGVSGSWIGGQRNHCAGIVC